MPHGGIFVPAQWASDLGSKKSSNFETHLELVRSQYAGNRQTDFRVVLV